MAPSLDAPPVAGLEGLCTPRDWVRRRGPFEGVELMRAWFSGHAYTKHRHDTYGICVTDDGVQTFDYRGKVERSLRGQVTVLHPDELHDGRAGTAGGFGYRILYVEPSLISAAVRVLTGRPGLPFVREPVSDNPRLAGAVHTAFASGMEPLAVDSLVLRLADGLLAGADQPARRPPNLDHTALARARAFLNSTRGIVRSTQLEQLTGLTRYELARQFRALYGTSPYRYSLLRRLDFARDRLRSGTPLAGLGLDAGFADQAHFTRMFGSAFGMTPRRYALLISTCVSECRAFDETPEFGPGELRMNASAHAAVGAGDHVFAADEPDIALNSLRN
ncbi:MAG TPA: AraC family transcriptional regulator [Chloroflexota bacterium]